MQDACIKPSPNHLGNSKILLKQTIEDRKLYNMESCDVKITWLPHADKRIRGFRAVFIYLFRHAIYPVKDSPGKFSPYLTLVVLHIFS